MRDAKKLVQVRKFIDSKQTYRFQMPDGSIIEYSGEQLIQTGEAFAELVQAGNSGDDNKMRAALQKIAELE